MGYLNQVGIKVYDTFLFFNELDLLEIRLNTLWDVVDYFVLVESNLTFQKKHKPLYFEKNKKRFEDYSEKIIHVVIDDPVTNYGEIPAEEYQRNGILRGLLNSKPWDRILVSDLDEIPNPASVKIAKTCGNQVLFEQPLYYYYVDYKCAQLEELPWTVMVSYENIKTPQEIRNSVVKIQAKILGGGENFIGEGTTLLKNAGWHFSYLGGIQSIIEKIEAFSHSEFNTNEFKHIPGIEAAIKNGKDLFGRKLDFNRQSNLAYLPKFLLENRDRYPKFFSESLEVEKEEFNTRAPIKMMFDQYSRYKACSDILRSFGELDEFSILDVGSGPECLLGAFISGQNISFLDPLIKDPDGLRKICGDVHSAVLNGRTFDCVVAVDVLEHIPADFRSQFLQKISSLSEDKLVLGFPTSDTTEAQEVDRAINHSYRSIYGVDYPWLQEHAKFGLPRLEEVVSELEKLGWTCQTIGHGHAPWLKELLTILIPIWDVPEMREFCLQISEEFNNALYEHDFQGPYYREFLIASRAPIDKKIILGESNNFSQGQELFFRLLESLKAQYIPSSLNGFLQKNDQIADRDKLILELNKMMTAKVSERDQQIQKMNEMLAALNSAIEEVSTWAKSLEKSLANKNDEAIKISDWALQLSSLLEERDNSLCAKVRSKIKSSYRLMKFAIRNLAIERPKYYMKRLRHCITLAAVKKSVQQNNGRLVIGFPIITWEFRWQRPQHILSGLRDGGFSILYLAISLLPVYRRFKDTKEAGSKIGFNNLGKNLNQVWLNSFNNLNIYTDIIEGDDLHNIVLGLSCVIEAVTPTSLIYMVQFPSWGPVALELKNKFGGKIVFDCMDDHAGFDTATEKILKLEVDLIEASDLVIASSELLADKIIQHTKKLVHIKNGTEFEHFNLAATNGLLDHLMEAPIVGYYGAISSWFDASLIAYCAKNRPNWNFVLIGSSFGSDLSSLEGLDNVYLIGEISYVDLPGYLAYFNVCTIPFKLIPLTLATNPVKFYEYLSAGKPVVSVRLPELIPYEQDCYLANNPEEFLAQIEHALREENDELKVQRRIKLAQENSWKSRVQQLMSCESLK